MEQFENQQPRSAAVKEKSVYLLHLDGARILILSAITIGLLTVAFLIGMKISGDGQKDEFLAQNDALIDQTSPLPQGQDLLDPSKTAIPEMPGTGTAEPLSPLASNGTSTLPDLPVAKINDPVKSQPADMMAADENHVVIPPAKEVAKSEPKLSKNQKSKSNKKDKLSRKKNNDIVEVSVDTHAKSAKKAKGGFMLQVASFDKNDVAKKEVNNLKSMDYDAFVDKTSVKGKNFYRVRIGPVASKDKALQMLDELQSNTRYAESYVTKE